MDGYAGKGHQVLLIDDDSEFCELMTDYLDVHSFAVSSVHTGTAGIEAARRQEYDVILLDMLLPDISGIEVLRHLRTETRAPVVILSAHNEETDRIVTLELGADDYVPKTFSARELLARIEAVLRRSPERPRQLREISIPGATLDSVNRLITFKDGRETSLTAREFEFLTYMATHPNRVITRDELLRRVWDVDPRLTDTRSVEMTVMRLRDKLGAASASPLETLRSQGYRWNSSFVS